MSKKTELHIILVALVLGGVAGYKIHGAFHKKKQTKKNEKPMSKKADRDEPEKNGAGSSGNNTVKQFLNTIIPNGGAHIILPEILALGETLVLQCIANENVKGALWLGPSTDSCHLEMLKAMNPVAAEKTHFLLAGEWNYRLAVLRKAVEDECTNIGNDLTLLKIAEKLPAAIAKLLIPNVKTTELAKFLSIPLSEALAIREKLMKKYKVNDEKVVGPLWLYELIVNTQFCSQFDTIVLDPLAAFVNTSSQISTGIVTRLINPSLEKKRNVFILHEENKNNGSKGGNALEHLSRSTVRIKLAEESKYIFRTHEKFVPIPISFMADLRGSASSGYYFEISNAAVPAGEKTGNPNIQDQILAVLGNAGQITRGELYGKVIGSPDSIDNALLKMRNGTVTITKVYSRKNSVDDIIERKK